jgi:hypothetical protein
MTKALFAAAAVAMAAGFSQVASAAWVAGESYMCRPSGRLMDRVNGHYLATLALARSTFQISVMNSAGQNAIVARVQIPGFFDCTGVYVDGATGPKSTPKYCSGEFQALSIIPGLESGRQIVRISGSDIAFGKFNGEHFDLHKTMWEWNLTVADDQTWDCSPQSPPQQLPLTPDVLEAELEAGALAKKHAEEQTRKNEATRVPYGEDIIRWLSSDPRMTPRRVATWRCDFSVEDFAEIKGQHDALAPFVQGGVIPLQNLPAAYNAYKQVPIAPNKWAAKRASSPACAKIPLCGNQVCLPGPRWTQMGWPDEPPQMCNPLSPLCRNPVAVSGR